ncbi:hypothetical protein, partial [Bacteroides faecis]|uniref:hypothetical protein n=2 Tax=Bacteroides faecis TaxID=674529 RepID=UPI0034A3F109
KPGLVKVWALCIKKGCASVLTQPLLYRINSTLYFTVFQQYTSLHRYYFPAIGKRSGLGGVAVSATSKSRVFGLIPSKARRHLRQRQPHPAGCPGRHRSPPLAFPL